MIFNDYPLEHMNESNTDYDIELCWFGFKNLILNYFKNLSDDKIKFTKSVIDISNKLNKLQEKQQYKEIYDEIYKYIYHFLNCMVNDYSNNNIYHDGGHIFTWLKRYNKIKDSIKIELNLYYNKYININEISYENILLIKLKTMEICVKKRITENIVKLLEKNMYEYLDYCLTNNLHILFNIICLNFNANDYFLYKNINMDINTPISAMKILKLLD